MNVKRYVPLLCIAALGAAAQAQADSGDFLVRGRATYLHFQNGQNNLPVKVEAGHRVIPEVDLVYFFADRWSTELVLSYPQTVDIKVGGAGAGAVKALPPTLLAQYHFDSLGGLTPYLGAGVNLTLYSSRYVLGGAAKVDSTSTGFALQAGFDYALAPRWSLNVDAKYIQMDTGVKVGGSKIGTLDLNPTTISLGLSYKLN